MYNPSFIFQCFCSPELPRHQRPNPLAALSVWNPPTEGRAVGSNYKKDRTSNCKLKVKGRKWLATWALWGQQQIWMEQALTGQNISPRGLIRNVAWALWLFFLKGFFQVHREESEGILLSCTPCRKTSANKCCRAAGEWWINCCSLSPKANNPEGVTWPDSSESQLLNGSFLLGHSPFPLGEGGQVWSR